MGEQQRWRKFIILFGKLIYYSVCYLCIFFFLCFAAMACLKTITFWLYPFSEDTARNGRTDDVAAARDRSPWFIQTRWYVLYIIVYRDENRHGVLINIYCQLSIIRHFFFFLHNETFTPTCCTCFQNSHGDHAHIPQFLRIKNTFYTGQSALKYNVKFLFYSFSKTLGNFWYLPKKGGESAVAVCTTD